MHIVTKSPKAQPQSEYFLVSESVSFNFRVPFAKTDVINLYPEAFAIDLLRYTHDKYCFLKTKIFHPRFKLKWFKFKLIWIHTKPGLQNPGLFRG